MYACMHVCMPGMCISDYLYIYMCMGWLRVKNLGTVWCCFNRLRFAFTTFWTMAWGPAKQPKTGALRNAALRNISRTDTHKPQKSSAGNVGPELQRTSAISSWLNISFRNPRFRGVSGFSGREGHKHFKRKGWNSESRIPKAQISTWTRYPKAESFPNHL